MSRVGKLPVSVPQGVKAKVENGTVFIEGPKGKLQFKVGTGVEAKLEGDKISFKADATNPQANANWGTARSTVDNMIEGVTKGWKRALEMNGVGFNAKLQGTDLVLSVGFSHDVIIKMPPIVKCTVSKTSIELESPDREVVGMLASKIRKVQPPEPYLGKGIKYAEETIRRKAGKAGKK